MSDSTKKYQIWIESREKGTTRGVFADESRSLLENLIENSIEVDHSCGGNGTCGTCCVQVIDGLSSLSEINEVELEMRNDRGFREDERLCCQSYVKGPIRIRIP